MWPVLLDMTKEESMQSLRNLELEAYAHLVSALRAQGSLNPDKRKLLKETSQVLNINQDRHKAEIRRAVNDEKLNTIAYHVTGLAESLEDWAQEGRRTVPLIARMAPQTAYSAIADEIADTANQVNTQLPPPACTERKRPPPQPTQVMMPEPSKGPPFRVPDAPRNEDAKKRKLSICPENSTLAQHLLGHSKMNRTQQMYRHRLKTDMRDMTKLKPQPPKVPFTPSPNGPKINIVQNITVQPPLAEESIEQIQNEINSYCVQKPVDPQFVPPNENQAPRPKIVTPAKTNLNVGSFKAIPTTPGPSGCDIQKTVKLGPKKGVSKPAGATPIGQKLIVVSNAQTPHSSSILQKTLSIPLVKNISVKNLEKFKIVTTSSQQIMSTPNNINSFKHKVMTVKTSPATKKVIPLSFLNAKGGIKVLPIGGKILAKTTTATSSSLYIVNTVGSAPKMVSTQPVTTLVTTSSLSKENGKSSVLGDILKASGVTTDDFDAQIEEFRIPNHVMEAETREQVESETAIPVEPLISEIVEEEKCEVLESVEEYERTEVVDGGSSETVFLQVQTSDVGGVNEATN